MRLFIILCLFASAFCYSLPQTDVDSSIDPYAFEDLINSTIEGFRPDIPEPLEIASLNFTFPPEDGAVITGNGTISNLKVSGLKAFEVTALNFAIIGTRLNLTLLVPTLDLYTDFDLNLGVASTIYIYGVGNITAHLDGLSINVSTQANLTGGLSVHDLVVSLYLGNATTFEIHGLFNDEELSTLVSDILTDLAAKLIDENQALVTQLLSPLVEDALNAILGSLLATTTAPPVDPTTALNDAVQ